MLGGCIWSCPSIGDKRISGTRPSLVIPLSASQGTTRCRREDSRKGRTERSKDVKRKQRKKERKKGRVQRKTTKETRNRYNDATSIMFYLPTSLKESALVIMSRLFFKKHLLQPNLLLHLLYFSVASFCFFGFVICFHLASDMADSVLDALPRFAVVRTINVRYKGTSQEERAPLRGPL